ncbi:MAG: hypothetical protein ACJ8FS_00705 [Sphingomicrobium sp.]
MSTVPSTWKIREMIEDRLETTTGEPRHVTDVEIEFIPEQDPEANWSVGDYGCKPEYVDTLNNVIDEVQKQLPVISF